MRSTALAAAALLTLAGGGALTGVGAAASGVPAYVLLSVNSRERAADDRTYEVDVSGSGRYVVFSSEGRNLSGKDARSTEGVADRRCSIGSVKPAVLPVPVCAPASRSPPDSTAGMACAWIGVGVV